MRSSKTMDFEDNKLMDVSVDVESSPWVIKRMLLQKQVCLVGLHGMAGVGKTTLARSLCTDSQLRGVFSDHVVFIRVAKNPDLKTILEIMWDAIIQRSRPQFPTAQDARTQIQAEILNKSVPALVILDDVWKKEDLECLLFEGLGYKTLVTTRDCSILPKSPSTQIHKLPLMGEKQSLDVFCRSAFGQTSIPDEIDEHRVRYVVSECGGLALALKRIGSYMRHQPSSVWQIDQNKLSTGQPISNYQVEGLLTSLQQSLDALSDQARTCFLDLAALPPHTKIRVDVLLDIWVYVRQMEWQDAFSVLLRLDNINLLTLTGYSGIDSISHATASHMYFSVHKTVRDVALYLVSQERLPRRSRLIMPRKEPKLPRQWKLLQEETFDADIVTIHTDGMKEDDWCNMKFHEAEALILLLSATDYCLPTFLGSMKRLKVLVIFNHGTNRATVKNFSALHPLSQIKAIHMKSLIIPEFQGRTGLEKISVTLCDRIGSSMCQLIRNHSTEILTNLRELELDCCTDLRRLPVEIAHAGSIHTLSISDCHILDKLPEELGTFSSLKVLRLHACLALKQLPSSIGKLSCLEYLDISVCLSLTELPEEIGMLENLNTLDMRECSRLTSLPKSVQRLRSLKHVICDEDIGGLWIQVRNTVMPELYVQNLEPIVDLDWLSD